MAEEGQAFKGSQPDKSHGNVLIRSCSSSWFRKTLQLYYSKLLHSQLSVFRQLLQVLFRTACCYLATFSGWGKEVAKPVLKKMETRPTGRLICRLLFT